MHTKGYQWDAIFDYSSARRPRLAGVQQARPRRMFFAALVSGWCSVSHSICSTLAPAVSGTKPYSSQPLVFARPPRFAGAPLCLVAVIPDVIDRPRVPFQFGGVL